jgi:predicted RNA-binding protein (virulence factor B family)
MNKTGIEIGKYNKLRITRFVDFGAYLTNSEVENGLEILIPAKYLDEENVVGDELEVFVYTDSEDRPIATTNIPFAQVGEFAYLQVVEVNRIGAFVDWGLVKNLLVPYSEQKSKMHPGGVYLVYIYLDANTNRVCASAKIDKYLGNAYPEYKRGEKVEVLVYGRTPIGYQVIVDNKHKGMIYANEVYREINVEEHLTAYVKHVREDGKIDLTLTTPGTASRINSLSDLIIELLKAGRLTVNDKSSPEEIKQQLHCSKKDFKKTIGALYKEHQIAIELDGKIVLKVK